MNNKNELYNLGIYVFVILLVASLLTFVIYILLNADLEPASPNIYNEQGSQVTDEISDINISNSNIKLIDSYSVDYFTADKNLLIMFGSWCAHCQTELKEIEKILDYYKDSPDINIVLIAHEFENTIPNLASMLQNDLDFGTKEVLVDLKRIIRGTIDPDASTVPISYVVDKTGTVLKKHDNTITLDIAKDLLK